MACGVFRERALGELWLGCGVELFDDVRSRTKSVLTGWQCLQLTTGLLKRWKVYYSPFATLIRLLALQGTPLLHTLS